MVVWVSSGSPSIKIHLKLRPNNHAYLVGPVKTETVNLAINTMNGISGSHILFYLNSPGGLVDEGDRLISYLRYRQDTGTNITCIAEKAHSMAFHIMQHCQLRLVTPSARMMQHQISLGINGELSKVNSYLHLVNTISQRLTREAAERIGITEEEFQRRVMSDWWLSGPDIVTAKVADAMVLVGCETHSSKNILDLPKFTCPLTIVPDDTIVIKI